MNDDKKQIDKTEKEGIKKEAKKLAEKLNIKMDFKNEVLQLIGDKKRDEATENITKKILKEEYIYTTRKDEKSEMWIYHEGIYIPNGKSYIKEVCRNILGMAYNIRLANRVINKIESETYIKQEELFKEENSNKIPLQNGILDIKKRELEEFNPKYTFFNKIEAEYDPNAECPKIIDFFDETLDNKTDIELVQEIFGYTLYKRYKYKKAFMFTDDETKTKWKGDSGKSTVLELLRVFLGRDNCVNISLQDLTRKGFARAELFKKMANLGGDISKTSIKKSGKFKELTGREMISADRKFKSRIHFRNYAKLIFSCNEIPITYDETHAFFTRWALIEFPYTFLNKEEIKKIDAEDHSKLGIKEADPNIIKKITEQKELNGLLNWSLDGLHRLIKKGHFTESESAREVKKKWIRKSDSFRAFTMDCLEQDYKCKMTKKILRRVYTEYCDIHGVNSMGDKHIRESLERNMGVSERRINWDDKNGRERIWEGIKFNRKKLYEKGIEIELEGEVKDNSDSRKDLFKCHRCTEKIPKNNKFKLDGNTYCKSCYNITAKSGAYNE